MVKSARRPIVLDVNPDFDSLDEEVAYFEARGIEVERCLGPDTSAGCPVLTGGACPKASRADAILCQLDLETIDHRKVFDGYRTGPGDLFAVVSTAEARSWPKLIVGINAIIGPPGSRHLDEIVKSCRSSAELE